MCVTSKDVVAATARVREAIAARYQELNAADARLGDGDTGSMLLRLTSAVAVVDADAAADVGETICLLARAAMKATGSSLGTLLATAMLTVGKATEGQKQISAEQWPDLLQRALDAMTSRGGAKLGDKTILDSVDALLKASLSLNADPAERYIAVARGALAEFRLRPNRIAEPECSATPPSASKTLACWRFA